MFRRCRPALAGILVGLAWAGSIPAQTLEPNPALDPSSHDERPAVHSVTGVPPARLTAPSRPVVRGAFTSVQVNVDGLGNDILSDAANEPSIAVDPTDPSRIVIGWRQFDNIASSFRQAGVGRSIDGGASWTASVIEPGIFRSDPVLGVDSAGRFFYYSLAVPGGSFQVDTFTSTDAGATWGPAVFSFGGDKAWLGVDTTGGLGDGHMYAFWSPGLGCCGDDAFNRSIDPAQSFETPIAAPGLPFWGTVAIGPTGTVYVGGASSSGGGFVVGRSDTLQDPGMPAAFDASASVDLGGSLGFSTGPNPGGLLGQTWVAASHAPGRSGHVYLLASVNPASADPLDVHFVRSIDGGTTWSAPTRLNDDPAGSNAWQWLGTMGVAPNGRIDVVWADTRNATTGFASELFYTRSDDGGSTWSANEVLSPSFDPHLGWPQQNKMGDYYHLVSTDDGAHLAYAATFTVGQDIYYLFIPSNETLFADGFESGDTSAWSMSVP